MNTNSKHISVAALGAVAIYVVGSTFVAGTAEAHCGDHAGSCGSDWDFYGSHCEGTNRISDWYAYFNYCQTPASGCSGPACLNWPCAEGACYGGAASGCTQIYAPTNDGYDPACEPPSGPGCGEPCDPPWSACAGGVGVCIPGGSCYCN